jgi:hypothetical protein
VIGASSREVFVVVVSHEVLYGGGRLEGSKRTAPVATFSHPL